MAAHVGNIQAKIRGKRVLDADVPVLQVRVFEVAIYEGDGTRRGRISRGVVAAIPALHGVGSGKDGCVGPVILPIRRERRAGTSWNGDGGGCNLAGAWCGYAVHYDRCSGRNGAYPAVGSVLTT